VDALGKEGRDRGNLPVRMCDEPVSHPSSAHCERKDDSQETEESPKEGPPPKALIAVRFRRLPSNSPIFGIDRGLQLNEFSPGRTFANPSWSSIIRSRALCKVFIRHVFGFLLFRIATPQRNTWATV
jgi:hypothetical protein